MGKFSKRGDEESLSRLALVLPMFFTNIVVWKEQKLLTVRSVDAYLWPPPPRFE